MRALAAPFMGLPVHTMRLMSETSTVMAFVAAALAVVSASLTGFGLRRRRYDGWQWWVAAAWLTSLGAAVIAPPMAAAFGAAFGASFASALAGVLLLQWPLLALLGLRRFHPRLALPGHRFVDLAVLALCSLLAAAAEWAGPLPWLGMAAGLTAHGYAATVLFMGPHDRDFAPVQMLAGTMALVALLAFMPGLAAAFETRPMLLRAVGAALGVVVLCFVAITLVCERTERQLRDSRRRLRTLANLDTLTQVPNRRHFAELADHALRHDEPGTAVLLIFDIDHFKQINDLFGHAAGDRALTLVSSAMLDHLRAMDVPGRQGGDEFVLLLRRAAPKDAMSVASRIVTEVQRRAPTQQLPTLTLSFGVVQINLGESIGSAMRRADQAMYEAKRQGRSRAVAAAGDERRPVFSESQRLGLLAA
jgi:diguanylate cyclase